MQRLVAELGRPVVLSDRALRQLARVRNAERVLLQVEGMEPSSSQLAERSGLSRTQVETLSALERAPRHLDEPVRRNEQASGTFGDLLSDPRAEDEYGRVEDLQAVERVRCLTCELGERERLILEARFGLVGPEQTLRQIGRRLNLSPERVRQLEERALGKLRDAVDAAA
jgi:DNA-directed RNA polymerase sigma subunit (sigma70/sigma32)